MKWNKLFDQILRETSGGNGAQKPNELSVSERTLSQPLDSVFEDVLKACENENTLNYTNAVVNKKSTPYGG